MPKKTANDLLAEAEAMLKSGELDTAAARYREVIRLLGAQPAAWKVRGRLGVVLMRLGRFDEAAKELTQVAAADPSTEARYRLAQAHAFAGRHAEASEILDGVLKDDPDHAPSIARAAALLQYVGRGEDALAMLDAAVTRGVRSREIAHTMATVAIPFGRERDAVDLLRPFAADATLSPAVLGEMNFCLGRLLDSMGDVDGAWAAYTEGNRLTRRRFDPDAHDRAVDTIIETFTVEAVRSIADRGEEGARAILVVGMPRSGTTLVDQILGAHPRVEAGGELRALNDAIAGIPGPRVGMHPQLNRVRGVSLQRARRSYLAALDAVSPVSDRVTDKMPQNFFHLGLVPAILPGASVVHCLRDPRDTALSCYFRSFVGGNAFSYDLVWIARYTRAYLRLMRHWTSVLPEAGAPVRLVDARYESLSENPGEYARAMVESLGLAWDEACLGFGASGKMRPTLEPDQAGKGVYASSVARWKRYERHLAPFIEAMGDDLAAAASV
jgi:tetratricopeptide (TPR) repeat protein